MASQRICDLWTVRSPRATDGASRGALRLFNNSLNINHKHELSFLRETRAAFARRVPTQGRSARLSGKAARESTQENILATGCRIFRKRRGEKENRSAAAQRRAAFAAGPKT